MYTPDEPTTVHDPVLPSPYDTLTVGVVYSSLTVNIDMVRYSVLIVTGVDTIGVEPNVGGLTISDVVVKEIELNESKIKNCNVLVPVVL